ncbi:ABC transporter substrate-binding protein [Cohnella sp. WQ 127256]|uniref:ABC transporter substrate-binding protein n=1 Tax=Cohnella sp. WQ 127256 TaxID=2938790 RepID=UPI0021183694|nr:extracellular solute-binding protein [Cohnella sp. WQ 127256]
MKRMKLVSLLLSLTVVLSACGGNNNEGSGSNNSGSTKEAGSSTEIKTVKVLQLKTEIVEGLNELKVEFEKEYPNIKLEIQTVGSDYGTTLKTKFASGDEPDIFTNGGYTDMMTWIDKMEDLSDQSWVKDVVPMAKEPMTYEGKLYGMPMNLEGFGYIYNKDLFAKAGITDLPKTYSQLEEAAKKLEAAGITAFSNGYQEWWIIGNQGINPPFAQQDDPDAFIKQVNEGGINLKDNQKFTDWANLIDLTVKYGLKNPLTIDYNTQVAEFANGKAAMMQQGNWAQLQIDEINPDLNVGILPMPLGEDATANDKINVGVPASLVVNKNSSVKEEAKIFLNWYVTSDIGKEYIVKKFKFIPGLSTIAVTDEDLGDVGAEIWKYIQEGKVQSLNAPKFPDGVAEEIASAVQAHIGGKLDIAQMYDQINASWKNLSK